MKLTVACECSEGCVTSLVKQEGLSVIEVWGRDADADDDEGDEDDDEEPSSSDTSGGKRRRDGGEDGKEALAAHIEGLFADLK